MRLEAILKLPADSPNLLLRFEPFGRGRREQLVREVLGLANADLAGDRYLVFGVHHDGAELKVVGLTDGDLSAVRADLECIRQVVEPELSLAEISAEIEDNRVAAMVLQDCGDPPYIVREDLSENLRRGECWVREAGKVRPAHRADFDRMYGRGPTPFKAPATPEISEKPSQSPAVAVGFNGTVDCDAWAVKVPDVSNPPSKQAAEKLKKAVEAKKSSESLFGKMDTIISRLVHTRLHGDDAPFADAGVNTMVEGFNAGSAERKEADQYFFYEEKAVKMNLAILNTGPVVLEDVVFELTLPRTPDFDVADRIFTPPGQNQSTLESELIGYPAVKRVTNSAQIREPLGALHPNIPADVFKTPLRLAVGPGIRARKVAVRYSITAQNLDAPITGRMTISFG